MEWLKLNKTKIAVALFLVVLFFALVSERAAAQPVLSLGRTVLNSENTFGEIGWQFGERQQWEAAATLIGHGWTKRGDIERNHAFSVSRIVRPSWKFLGAANYYRIGAASVHGSPLVGGLNYRLGVGLDWGVVALEYVHYSSAGIHDPNTGIDGVQLRVPL